MKVLYYHQYFSTPAGTAGTRSYALARSLVEAGHQVQMVCLQDSRTHTGLSGPFYAGCRSGLVSGIEIIEFDLPYSNHAGLLERALVFLRFSWQSLRLALRSDADLLFATTTPLTASIPGIAVRWLRGTPFVFEVRDLWPQVLIDQGGKSTKSLIVRILAWMERELYCHASIVVVLAKGAEPFVRERGARQTAWLPNGPDLALFTPRPLLADRPVFTVLYAGAHGDANALDNVLAAARLLQQQGSVIRFRLVGDGPEKQDLIQQAIDLQTVTFEDPVPKAEIPALMAESDAILLSLRDVPLFRYGVSPNKLYDAYALGRPVITTVAGVINQEVEEYGLGVTASPGDPQALAEAIERLSQTSPQERLAMANRARHLAQTIYSRQRINAQYDSCLREVLVQR